MSLTFLKLVTTYLSLAIKVGLLYNLKIDFIQLVLFQIQLYLVLLVLKQLLSIIDYPVLQVVYIDPLLFALIFLRVNLFLLVCLCLLLHSAKLFLFSLGDKLSLLVFPL